MRLNWYVRSKNKKHKKLAQGHIFLGVLGCMKENQEKIENCTGGLKNVNNEQSTKSRDKINYHIM